MECFAQAFSGSRTSTQGPIYFTPLDAMKGHRERVMYVTCVQPKSAEGKYDLLATIDVDPDSPTYCEIIHKLHTLHLGDELCSSGWCLQTSMELKEGICKTSVVKNKLILPCLVSDRIYIIDTVENSRVPTISQVIKPSRLHYYNCSTPHTSHTLPTGEIMVSILGDNGGGAKGDFILIDPDTFEVKGTWIVGLPAPFGYDFWFQPFHDILISTEWGPPKVWKRGYFPIDKKSYGHSLNLYSFQRRELLTTIDLGEDGIAPFAVRFLHNPLESQAFVGCSMNANVFRVYQEDEDWIADKVIDIPPKKVTHWAEDYLQGMLTDLIISLDDKYLYLSNWFHGDVRQYDISNPKSPKLTGQVFLGGKILSDSIMKLLEDPELSEPPEPVFINGKRLYGGPNKLQLSLDGLRLYVTSSLYSIWDAQLQPDEVTNGGFMVKLDVDVEKGGMSLDYSFLVDFNEEPDGPILPHDMRYPGGDCSSEIWTFKK